MDRLVVKDIRPQFILCVDIQNTLFAFLDRGVERVAGLDTCYLIYVPSEEYYII